VEIFKFGLRVNEFLHHTWILHIVFKGGHPNLGSAHTNGQFVSLLPIHQCVLITHPLIVFDPLIGEVLELVWILPLWGEWIERLNLFPSHGFHQT
jgi:hypothetical protein